MSAEQPPASKRVALGIEYDGSHFHGWQLQAEGAVSVQGALEEALSAVADHPVRTFCAGRTDTGVHATEQVVHFDALNDRPLKAWVQGVNANMPDSVRVRWAQIMPEDFHARFSAIARRYVYVIDTRKVKPALLNRQLSWCPYDLDAELMQQGAEFLLGEHDFTSYRTVHCQSKTPVRNVHHLRVQRQGTLVTVDIKANAFLHHMVRNIAGVLITIGRGLEPPDWTQTVLEYRDRTLGGITAPPNGLYLTQVEYPEKFVLPESEQKLPFLG